MMISPERVQLLNIKAPADSGRYVLYWMQQSQRAEFNHALAYAVSEANRLRLPLYTVFGLNPDYPEANARHYTFLLEGLQETERTLAKMGIPLIVRIGHPPEVALELSKAAALIVCDRGYLRHLRDWRSQLASEAECRVVQVESDVVVPVDVVSDKAEFAARTIRPKLWKQLPQFLVPVPQVRLRQGNSKKPFSSLPLQNIDWVIQKLGVDRSVPAVSRFFRGGTSEAKRRFEHFVQEGLPSYIQNRARPEAPAVSHMSPYLHFGQISPLFLALKILRAPRSVSAERDAFLEELIVRRELSFNFVTFDDHYDSLQSVPDWALRSLHQHQKDKHEHFYTRQELENARTHDPYWNAAMTEIRTTGYLHNHLRMYWGKRIIEWTHSPEEAHQITLDLMNRYYLDGRDANSYANVAWLFGRFDRAWGERPVFGKVRTMTPGGLKRNSDIDQYVESVQKKAG